jgi:hypothetical protein
VNVRAYSTLKDQNVFCSIIPRYRGAPDWVHVANVHYRGGYSARCEREAIRDHRPGRHASGCQCALDCCSVHRVDVSAEGLQKPEAGQLAECAAGSPVQHVQGDYAKRCPAFGRPGRAQCGHHYDDRIACWFGPCRCPECPCRLILAHWRPLGTKCWGWRHEHDGRLVTRTPRPWPTVAFTSCCRWRPSDPLTTGSNHVKLFAYMGA